MGFDVESRMREIEKHQDETKSKLRRFMMGELDSDRKFKGGISKRHLNRNDIAG